MKRRLLAMLILVAGIGLCQPPKDVDGWNKVKWGMTVAQALAYPLQLRQVKATQIERQVADLCDRWEIPQDWLGRSDVQLSQGQRQWVCLARAFIPGKASECALGDLGAACV